MSNVITRLGHGATPFVKERYSTFFLPCPTYLVSLVGLRDTHIPKKYVCVEREGTFSQKPWTRWTPNLTFITEINKENTMGPLNPTLFRALQRAFHHVEIANQGLRAAVHHRPNWHRGGKLSADVSGGEYYRVCCPFCGDTRKRLWFHYLWGTKDEKTNQELLHLATCYNEECIDCRDRQIQLTELVFAYAREVPMATTAITSQSDSASFEQRRFQLPSKRVYINNERCPAHARNYLEDRGFDLAELRRHWHVAYCAKSLNSSPKVIDRLVIPVYQPKRQLATAKRKVYLAGWQARCVGDEGGGAKYLNAARMRKSALLYGLTRALQTMGPIVVCEGVTDVWRLGTNAVSLFGKNMSVKQLNLLLWHFKGRPLVVFLDNDATDAAQNARKQIWRRRSVAQDSVKVVVASLPKDKGDIGECSREEAWDCVAGCDPLCTVKNRGI